MSEATPLLETNGTGAAEPVAEPTFRDKVFEFLEAKTPAGLVYEWFTIILIIVNVFAFILATLFVEGYNENYVKGEGVCKEWCDTLFFGNYDDNYLSVLDIGSTSVLEIFTVAVFSIDYLCRVWTADLEDEKFAGLWGRILYLPTFYSIVDLASTVPFYIDAFALPNTDLVASQFLRMFRLFRMMRVEGRYDTALTMFDDVFYEQKGILGTALFVGVTTWVTVSSLYYLVERRSNEMIYCGAAPDYCGDPDEIDVSLCDIDKWGITDCTNAGCPPTDGNPEPCYNLYKSIPMASYYSLLNLFGEFPLVDQHSVAGMVVGTIVAVVAVAVFALPAGIIGNGFEDLIERRRAVEAETEDEDGRRRESHITEGYVADSSTTIGSIYNFMFARTTRAAEYFDDFINTLIVGAALTFMLDTLPEIESGAAHVAFDVFELFAVVIFTVEYILRIYSIKQDPKYSGMGGRVRFMWTFLMIVDLLTVAPYWIEVGVTGQVVTPTADTGNIWSTLVKTLRLLRLLRFEKYTHAFRSFDDVISDNLDVLAVTGFTAMLFWVFFAAILYFTERNNPDEEMASNYNNVPNAMWMTLLNLTGESPLAQYSVWGKIITGILGLFATGLFGIPIGVLGAGFEEVVEEENEDDEGELNGEDLAPDATADDSTSFEKNCYLFVNGEGSKAGQYFEISIYILIMVSVAVGIWQTVDGHEDDYPLVEWFAIVVFTIEYLIRFIGVPADPLFGGPGKNGLFVRIRFIFSFYSIIDLLAILPFYIAVMFPSSIVNDYDEMLRMFRLLRLIKLDKYVPSITLIDDVVRLKKNALIVAGFAAGTLWILFAALIYLTEHTDDVNEIDNVPLYGCYGNCTMEDRFQDYFDSWVYTGIHLTGDYPITTYTWPARFVNFFMVIAAVGVVSIPSGLIANGFVTIVDSKTKVRRGEDMVGAKAGDDWYEIRRRELETVEPPLSRWGPTVDKLQYEVNDFLNGSEDENGNVTWTPFARFSRVFIFTVIILNVVAVLVESVPEVDRAVGNQPGNIFDTFEFFSVMVFALEYALRLFCAPKNRDALYSSWTYATTFFGIVDFLSTAPWFIEHALIYFDVIQADSDAAMIFRIFRIFRMLQLEDFVVAFSKLDNVFRASKDVFKATGLLAIIIWVGCAALFYIFEENNPNWRSCDMSVPAHSDDPENPGCYDFASTAKCNEAYPGLCEQKVFTNIPNALYLTAVFLGGEWGVVDFTWPGRFVCLFLCVAGIGLYAIPIGTLFDSFGAVLGMGGDDEEDEEDEEEK